MHRFRIVPLLLLGACIPLSSVQDAPSGARRCFDLPRPTTGRPLDYAAQKGWYMNDEALSVFEDTYVRLGHPIAAEMRASQNPPIESVYVGEYDGVPMYIKPSDRTQMPNLRLVYLLVNPGCDLQGFAKAEEVR